MVVLRLRMVAWCYQTGAHIAYGGMEVWCSPAGTDSAYGGTRVRGKSRLESLCTGPGSYTFLCVCSAMPSTYNSVSGLLPTRSAHSDCSTDVGSWCNPHSEHGNDFGACYYAYGPDVGCGYTRAGSTPLIAEGSYEGESESVSEA
eukprot:2006922-Rhodomonas_salina.1